MKLFNYSDIPTGMFEKLMDIEDYINESSIELQMLELIRLRVAQLNGCAYCVDIHHKELSNLGESDLRLSSLCVWEETPYFSEKERAVLYFTDTITRISTSPIPEHIFDTLTTHFSKEEITFLTLAIAQINTWTRLMRTFRFAPGNYKVKEPV